MIRICLVMWARAMITQQFPFSVFGYVVAVVFLYGSDLSLDFLLAYISVLLKSYS